MSDTVSLAVSGMKCGGCENSLRLKLIALAGISEVKASHVDKKVDVEYDSALINLDQIEDAIVAAGYEID